MADEGGSMEVDSQRDAGSDKTDVDDLPIKQTCKQDDVIKENGIDEESNDAMEESSEKKTNGPVVEGDAVDENMEAENVDTELPKPQGDESTNQSEGDKDSPDSNDGEKEESTSKEVESTTEPTEIDESENKETDDALDNDKKDTEEDLTAAEQMEVDEDSNAPESVSNISAPVSVDTDSKQASLMSEDNSESRDSVGSGSMKSTSDADLSSKDGFVGKVKGDEGEDILITLNENDKNDDSDQEESQEATVKADDKKEIKESAAAVKKPEASPATPATPASQSVLALIPADVADLIPKNEQVVKQGDKVGYLTKVGNQNVFVPVGNVQPVSNVQTPNAVNKNVTPKSTKTPPIQIKLDDLKPKSSMEMIELMRWELFNRVPDNFNWSVAFHPKKEELSTVTSFLLELGHDVVKEAVYKDIIQIQTKKKENGDLKENEIESLEKMKTVYDNTKKKVEHLFLDQEQCDRCEFKTESNVVLSFHKDSPHYDPPWDTQKGMMRCSHCKYSTRVGLQFSLHMETMHKLHAKFPEKEYSFNCELCPLSTSTKNKLDKHRQKCEKHFKLSSNLQPYFHDVNFCMKNMYYKPRKPIPPKPSPQQQPSPANPRPAPARTPIAANIQQRSNLTPQRSPQNVLDKTGKPILPPMPKLQGPIRPPFQSSPAVKFPGAPAAMSNIPPRPLVPGKGGKQTTNKDMQGFEVCELCGGYVKDRQALRIHFYYAHKVEMPQAIFARPTPPLICDVCQAKFWTTQGLSKHKSSLRHFSSTGPAPAAFGTNQKCFMCMKKVPNLFSHVEQVHGMSMKDLVAMKKCIMCGVTANDKRSLETHLASAHGILMKATDLLGSDKPAARPTNSPQPQVQQKQQQQAPPPKGKPNNLARQNLCVFCQIQFADNIQLTMHCIKVHATCNGCGMVVASSKHLMYHSCKVMKRKCIICGLKNIAPEMYAAHVKSHVKPCNVKVDKLSEEEIDGVKQKIKKEYKPQVISLDSDEDSEDEIFDKKASENEDKKDSVSKADKKDDKVSNGESQGTKLTNGDVKSESVENTEEEKEDNRSDDKDNENNQSSNVENDSENQDSNEKTEDKHNDMEQSDENSSGEPVENNDENSSDKPIENNVEDKPIENNVEKSPGKPSENEVDEVSDHNNENSVDSADENRKRKFDDEQSDETESDVKRVKVDAPSNENNMNDANEEIEEESNIDM